MSGCPNQRSYYSYGMPTLNVAHPLARGMKMFQTAQHLNTHSPVPVGILNETQDKAPQILQDCAMRGMSWKGGAASQGCGSQDNGLRNTGVAPLWNPSASGSDRFPPARNNFTIAAYANRQSSEAHSAVSIMGSLEFVVNSNGAGDVWKKVSGTWRDLGNTAAGTFPTTGRPEVVAVTCSSVDGVKLYYRGLLVHTYTGSYITSDIDQTDDYRGIFGIVGYNNYNFLGIIYWHGFWNRPFTDGEHAALARDPLALIQPSRFAAPGWARGTYASTATPWLYASRPAAMIGGR